jgi:hypothetical protein
MSWSNVWRKTVEDLNVHIMYSSLVYGKISYGMIKIIELSCTFSIILCIQKSVLYSAARFISVQLLKSTINTCFNKLFKT